MKNKSIVFTLILLCSAQGLMGMNHDKPNKFQLAECKITSESAQTQTDTKKTKESNSTTNDESAMDLLSRFIPVDDLHDIIFNQAKEWQDQTESAMTFNNALFLRELSNSRVAIEKTDDTIEIWDTNKKMLIKTVSGCNPERCADKLMYELNNNTIVYDVDNDTSETLPGTKAEILENGLIATTVEGDDVLKIWNLSLNKEKRCVATLPFISSENKESKENMENVFNSPICHNVIALSNGNFAYYNHEKVRIIDPTKTRKEQIIKEIAGDDIDDICTIRDLIAVQKFDDTKFSIYNLVTLKEETKLSGQFHELLPDNRILLTLDDELYVWDTTITDKTKQIKIPGEFSSIDNNVLRTRIDLASPQTIDNPNVIEYMWDVLQAIPEVIAAVPLKFGQSMAYGQNLIDNNIVAFEFDDVNSAIKIVNPNNNYQTVATLSLPQQSHFHQCFVSDAGTIMTWHDDSNTIRIWEPTKACALEKAYNKENAIEKAKRQFAKLKLSASPLAQALAYKDFVAKQNNK